MWRMRGVSFKALGVFTIQLQQLQLHSFTGILVQIGSEGPAGKRHQCIRFSSPAQGA